MSAVQWENSLSWKLPDELYLSYILFFCTIHSYGKLAFLAIFRCLSQFWTASRYHSHFPLSLATLNTPSRALQTKCDRKKHTVIQWVHNVCISIVHEFEMSSRRKMPEKWKKHTRMHNTRSGFFNRISLHLCCGCSHIIMQRGFSTDVYISSSPNPLCELGATT